jgi:outer membrane protein OmpA-like peptidoglycan-associated protein
MTGRYGKPGLISLILLITFMAAGVRAEQNYRDLAGNVKIGPVEGGSVLKVPYITWGGDMATFYANGGTSTRKGSIFDQKGLSVQLTQGDNFVQQVRDYMSGKSPFLRGTFHMIGLASELINADKRTQGMVIAQMTWSAGDHMVARSGIKTAQDLKGKTIVLQRGGPHVGMLDDILKTAKLDWKDIKVIWASDLTGGSSSPAAIFRKNPQVDACFVISPDMIGLTGGLTNTGSGAEGTVAGAKVLVSTADLSRSIADVYVCRKDYFDAHPDIVTKFVSGYLKACEEVLDLKKAYEAKGSADYMKLLKLTQDIYGKDVIPTLEEDAHGLLSDCTFVGYPGNVAFFTQKNNLHGFDAFQQGTLDLAVKLGYARTKIPFLKSGVNFSSSDAFTGYLKKTKAVKQERFRGEAVKKEIELLGSDSGLDDRTIVSFTISFEPNQMDFNVKKYKAEYDRVIQMADKYGNAVVAIRGHSDPSKTLLDLVKAGVSKGVLKRTGSSGNYSYSFNGKALDLGDTQKLVKLVESGGFDGVAESNPRETMQAALNLSKKRADAVRKSILAYAKSKGLPFDVSQIQSAGVGISEPFIAKPSSMDEAMKNMRVEFRLMKVNAEAVKKSDFDF